MVTEFKTNQAVLDENKTGVKRTSGGKYTNIGSNGRPKCAPGPKGRAKAQANAIGAYYSGLGKNKKDGKGKKSGTNPHRYKNGTGHSNSDGKGHDNPNKRKQDRFQKHQVKGEELQLKIEDWVAPEDLPDFDYNEDDYIDIEDEPDAIEDESLKLDEFNLFKKKDTEDQYAKYPNIIDIENFGRFERKNNLDYYNREGERLPFFKLKMKINDLTTHPDTEDTGVTLVWTTYGRTKRNVGKAKDIYVLLKDM